MLGVPLGEIAVLVAAILVAGVCTGILAGLFGIGGGAIIVPVLYEAFRILGVPEEVRMQLCVGTSLAIIVPTSIRSFLSHRASRELPVEVLRGWVSPIVLAIIVGATMAAFIPSYAFKLVFVVFTALIALRMLFNKENWRLGDRLPGKPTMWAIGFVTGLQSAVMGTGGGSISTLALMLYGTPIHVAVGISAGVGVIISTVGTIGYALAGLPQQALMPPFSIGYVSLIGLVLMAPVSAVIAPYGARLAHRMSKRKLEIAFGVFLLLVAARFTASLF
jgi:uncharacterized membrane protein YfcA